eukprot:gene4722-biopygen13032
MRCERKGLVELREGLVNVGLQTTPHRTKLGFDLRTNLGRGKNGREIGGRGVAVGFTQPAAPVRHSARRPVPLWLSGPNAGDVRKRRAYNVIKRAQRIFRICAGHRAHDVHDSSIVNTRFCQFERHLRIVDGVEASQNLLRRLNPFLNDFAAKRLETYGGTQKTQSRRQMQRGRSRRRSP